jgi:two-component system, chemotaxis family, protein-glutamate methylesterase/glutaminase
MYKAVIIGGSAGSFPVVSKILSSLPENFNFHLFLCLHRLKHVRSGFVETLSLRSKIKIIEPYDKEQIRPGRAYLAPANYHMYIEIGNSIALSTEENVNHSRPSIDLSFSTAAKAYRDKVVGIILSGANKDGAYGLTRIKELGGTAIVQDPNESEIKTMPESVLKMTKVDYIYNTDKIIEFLNKINK